MQQFKVFYSKEKFRGTWKYVRFDNTHQKGIIILFFLVKVHINPTQVLFIWVQ